MTALANHIAAHALSGWPWACLCGGWSSDPESGLPDRGTAQTVRAAHAAHVAETWAEHRTVTTVKDGLDLPDGTVLRDAEGEVHLLHAPSPTPITLPARILHNPEEDQ